MHEGERPRARWVRWLEWTTVGALVVGVAVYLLWKPINPMADPQAALALALVQTHPARQAVSVRQALDTIMQANQKSGRSPSMSEWTVQHNNRTQDRQGYLVRVQVRLPGDQGKQWIEWEYLWLVRLSSQEVIPLSRPAVEVMPE